MSVKDKEGLIATGEEAYADEKEDLVGHQIDLSITLKPEKEVIVGDKVELQVSVSCPSACNFIGKTLRVESEDGVVLREIELAEYDGTESQTEQFGIPSPGELGETTWTVVFEPDEEELVIHDKLSHTISFEVLPHPTSMSIWDVESPVIAGEELSVTVGVKCHKDCNLGHGEITVYDHNGTKIATDVLGSELYSDTIDLYWKSLKLQAPQEIGSYTWEVEFTPSNLEIPHQDSRFSFPFSTMQAPDCWLTVKVVDVETGNPINNAQVAIRPNLQTYYSNDDGTVKFGLPKGEHKLYISAGKVAPKGISYKIGEVPRVTRGYEYMIYVPEENKETLESYEKELKIEKDITIVVELVGVVEPPEDTTL